mmetsp:Transcript_2295/g.5233  ORF Transcript_2295/g.5233 Transcript_2295/m.5233 type:complete len:84 (-) Transcript_2295:888-1139(-)
MGFYLYEHIAKGLAETDHSNQMHLRSLDLICMILIRRISKLRPLSKMNENIGSMTWWHSAPFQIPGKNANIDFNSSRNAFEKS